MAFCGNCGQVIESGACCDRCGTPTGDRRSAATSARSHRRRFAVLGGGLILLLVVVGVLLFSGHGTSNGLVASYRCSYQGKSETLNFSNTGDADGNGLAGTIIASVGSAIFTGGSIHDSRISFGTLRGEADNRSFVFHTTGTSTLEPGGDLRSGDGAVCVPS